MMKFYFDLLKNLAVGAIAYWVLVYGFCHVVLLIANIIGVSY